MSVGTSDPLSLAVGEGNLRPPSLPQRNFKQSLRWLGKSRFWHSTEQYFARWQALLIQRLLEMLIALPHAGYEVWDKTSAGNIAQVQRLLAATMRARPLSTKYKAQLQEELLERKVKIALRKIDTSREINDALAEYSQGPQ